LNTKHQEGKYKDLVLPSSSVGIETMTKRILISLTSGVLLTAALYSLCYVLSRSEGPAQEMGYLIGVLLAFPFFMFFHDSEPPAILIVVVALFDVLILSVPAFAVLMARRKGTTQLP